MVETTKTNEEVNNYLVFENTRHGNKKEILSIQSKMEDKRFKQKMDFTKFLYGLKRDFADREQANKIIRIKLSKSKR